MPLDDMTPEAPLPPLPPEEELSALAKTFYDKVYAHPWIGRFFRHVDQARQEVKLVRFLLLSWGDASFGSYQGQYLREEHANLYITDELFDLRQALFAETLREHGHGGALVGAFLAFNERWRSFVVKRSVQECEPTYPGEEIVVVPRPA
ncbi:group I truncated hemoglobin [Paraliomyxa miuraensis]|uniref:group I truncated hemoglobin n=1 Tax=Paraliomyxa miuraensis TaxID=376150 RepID=UPI0022568453|nr:group 1 truncated hemoglobin [Paraliomyxa miuraensis]